MRRCTVFSFFFVCLFFQLLQGCVHDSFDCMHAVFRLVKLSCLRAEEDVVADFHGFQSVLLLHLFADFGFTVVERGQTMQEDRIFLRTSQQFSVDLVRMKQFDSLCP